MTEKEEGLRFRVDVMTELKVAVMNSLDRANTSRGLPRDFKPLCKFLVQYLAREIDNSKSKLRLMEKYPVEDGQ